MCKSSNNLTSFEDVTGTTCIHSTSEPGVLGGQGTGTGGTGSSLRPPIQSSPSFFYFSHTFPKFVKKRKKKKKEKDKKN